ncbi:MAG: helix-turn-helix domain-containing protein [Ruminococcus sp.]|nr:helix-turn-helix domain-containing protein [Ruminococcus sp.]
MELGKQIKKYRTDKQFSQEQLAERIFVSRQTISNWENDKNYPDIKSLLLLSEVFEISLDDLVKGDLEEMKKQINNEDIKEFKKLDIILTICFILVIVTPILLLKMLGFVGIAIWVALYALTMFFAIRTERFKKKHNIQTYREITAFMNGDSISGTEKIQETTKRPYQKILCVVGMGIVAFVVCIIMGFILK